MTKGLRLALMCIALAMLASTAYCVDVYPTVDFAFDASSFEYSWTVNYTPDVNVYFTIFQVYSELPALSWTSASGAWSGSPAADEGWAFTYPENGDGVSLRWYGDSTRQRKPSGGAWTGVFKVTVPNSQPVSGEVLVYGSALKQSVQASMVPGIVPEPSSMLALGSMVGLIPLLMRRRKQ